MAKTQIEHKGWSTCSEPATFLDLSTSRSQGAVEFGDHTSSGLGRNRLTVRAAAESETPTDSGLPSPLSLASPVRRKRLQGIILKTRAGEKLRLQKEKRTKKQQAVWGKVTASCRLCESFFCGEAALLLHTFLFTALPSRLLSPLIGPRTDHCYHLFFVTLRSTSHLQLTHRASR